MKDADLDLLRGTTPVWDELREQRVLARIEAELQAPAVAGAPSPRPRTWVLLACAAALFLSVVAGAKWWLTRAPAQAATPDQIASSTAAENTTPEPSTLRLPDGSVARMDARAHVDVEVQSEALVRLLQSRGSVRYDVSRNANREFIVDVGDVRVRVLGTAFTITTDATTNATMMSVEVHHGRVEVRRGERRTELGKGETLRLETRLPPGTRAADPSTNASTDSPTAPPTDPRSEHEAGDTDDADIVVLDDEEFNAPGNGHAAAVGTGGDTAAEQAAAGVTRPRAGRRTASVDTLLLRADQARADGRLADAASALRELVRHHNKDTQAYSAWFQLGKVERARGRHSAAAAAFARCAKRSPGGALSEDARAEAAVSWRAAGKTTRANEAAQRYLTRHPHGTHAARMQRILTAGP